MSEYRSALTLVPTTGVENGEFLRLTTNSLIALSQAFSATRLIPILDVANELMPPPVHV